MDFRFARCSAAGLALALAFGAGALAQTQEPGAGAEAAGAPAAPAQPSAQEQADAKLVETAFSDLQRRQYPGLGRHIPNLEKALERASPTAASPEVYVYASLLVGSFYVEMHQQEKAIAALDKGLTIAPGHPVLSSEKATALSSLRRFDESLAALDAGIAAEKGSAQDRARLHRMRGVVLIDLKRLDDAEAALKQSLTLHPNHPVALNELKYIAQIRSGAVAADKPVTVMTSDEAAKTPIE